MPQVYEGFETGPKPIAGLAKTFTRPRRGTPAAFRNVLGTKQERAQRAMPEALAGVPRLKPGRTLAKPDGPAPELRGANEIERIWSDPSHESYEKTNLVLRPSYSLEQVIEIQRQQISLAQYTEIGRLKLVVFGEPARGAPTPPRDQTNVWGIRLDWMQEGPMLALSNDLMHVLVIGAMTHPPRIPHPGWEPKHGTYIEYTFTDGYKSTTCSRQELEKHGVVKDWKQHKADRPGKPDLIEQKYSDRSNACWPNEAALRRGEGFIVFAPIAKVMFQNKRGFGYVSGLTDPADGTKFSLLINPKHKLRGEPWPEGFFCRGRFVITQGPEV
jgi:hypothetical protein